MELIILFATLSAANIIGVSLFTSDEKAKNRNEYVIAHPEPVKKGSASMIEALFSENESNK